VSNPQPVIDFDAALALIGSRSSSVVSIVSARVGHALEIMLHPIGYRVDIVVFTVYRDSAITVVSENTVYLHYY